jgi:hypothetical protein
MTKLTSFDPADFLDHDEAIAEYGSSLNRVGGCFTGRLA